MALGAVEVAPVEMAQAYAAFSNGGYAVKAYGIERIRTASGKVLYDHGVARPQRTRLIEAQPLDYMIQMMRQVLVSGSGASAAYLGLRSGRQDWHDLGLPGRLVRGLHRRLHRRRSGSAGTTTRR